MLLYMNDELHGFVSQKGGLAAAAAGRLTSQGPKCIRVRVIMIISIYLLATIS
jgi:hypothetical protein